MTSTPQQIAKAWSGSVIYKVALSVRPALVTLSAVLSAVPELELLLLFSILLDNAVKYAEGDKVIHVRLYREGKRAVFETENDWARNVDPAKIETLFDRFTRGDRSRSGADGKNGFGLGLAIARSAAEKNHATLNASVTAEGKLRFTLKI